VVAGVIQVQARVLGYLEMMNGGGTGDTGTGLCFGIPGDDGDAGTVNGGGWR
jgi:hypothetical protein